MSLFAVYVADNADSSPFIRDLGGAGSAGLWSDGVLTISVDGKAGSGVYWNGIM